jgi:hypothetical protein
MHPSTKTGRAQLATLAAGTCMSHMWHNTHRRSVASAASAAARDESYVSRASQQFCLEARHNRARNTVDSFALRASRQSSPDRDAGRDVRVCDMPYRGWEGRGGGGQIGAPHRSSVRAAQIQKSLLHSLFFALTYWARDIIGELAAPLASCSPVAWLAGSF